jgi:hypothetical protein
MVVGDGEDLEMEDSGRISLSTGPGGGSSSSSSESSSERMAYGLAVVISGVEVEVEGDGDAWRRGKMKSSRLASWSSRRSGSKGDSNFAVGLSIVPKAESGRNSSS